MSVNIENERTQKLDRIKRFPPEESIHELHSLRKDYDWAIPGYRNSLNILSDTAYQDRKHFILELIQNADDADYSERNPAIRFVIDNSGIKINYNEDGFSVDDVIAITDTGESTKIKKDRSSHTFIGEKGIGFKSVFALASSVEIRSHPWYFRLNKDECVIPYPVENKKTEQTEGTELKITFVDPDKVNPVADEILKIATGQMESMLFLNQLSSMTVEDRRKEPPVFKELNIQPENRNGEYLEITSAGNQHKRKYYLYRKDQDFPGDLVKQRWEKFDFGGSSLKRRVSVAFPVVDSAETLPEGRLYCYLPTLVTLPSPMFLQVDGATTADREKLHDPENNEWNRYMLSALPGIIADAVISLKKVPAAADRLPDYIPSDSGDQQLSPQFDKVIELLKNKKWVKTMSSGKDEWVLPEDAVIPSEFLRTLIKTEPLFRSRAEKYLGKRFVNTEWIVKKEWKSKLKSYGVPELDDMKFIEIIHEGVIPKEWMKSSENLISLYSEIRTVLSKNKPNDYHHGIKYENLCDSLLRSPIFPLPERGFFPLKSPEKENKIFWIKSRSSRKTGLEDGVDYTIVSTEYTYEPRIRTDRKYTINDEAELKLKIERNRKLRELLKELNVQELDDENILKELQIPYLIENTFSKDNGKTKYSILYAVFEKYRNRINKDGSETDKFNENLSRLGEAEFISEKGNIFKIKDLLLPEILKLSSEDHIYDNFFDNLKIPGNYFPASKKPRRKSDRRADSEKIKKLKENFREFLILTGIRHLPTIYTIKEEYENVNDFREKQPKIFDVWDRKINSNYTYYNPVTTYRLELDSYTKKIINNWSDEICYVSKHIYNQWCSEKEGIKNPFSWRKIKFGDFCTEYFRRTDQNKIFRDPHWCGLERSLIPVQDVNDETVPSGNCIKVKESDLKKLKKVGNYFHICAESDCVNPDENGKYHHEYLESLEVKYPDVNLINRKLNDSKADSELYEDILKTVTEFHSVGTNIRDLKIKDKVTGNIRPVTDFCMGKESPDNRPLIEVQYGKTGTEIGEIVGLQDAAGAGIYSGFFESILKKRVISGINQEILLDILRSYPSWSRSDKRMIDNEFSDFLSSSGRSEATIVFGDKEAYDSLYNAKIWVFNAEVSDDELFGIKETAENIGFIFSEEIGELIADGKKAISEEEINSLNRILLEYEKNLSNQKSKSKLKSRLSSIGISDFNVTDFFRANKIFRKLDSEEEGRPISLPYFDTRKNIFYISSDADICDIFAFVLESADYGNSEDLIERVRKIHDNILKGDQSTETDESVDDIDTETEITQPEDNTPENSVDEIRKLSKENLVRNKGNSSAVEEKSGWKVSPDPIEDLKIREILKKRLKKSLEEGPEVYDRRLRKQRKRTSGKSGSTAFKDPDSVDPKSYFEEEYGGRCQVCGIQLRLKNGNHYSVTYHIVENQKGKTWYKDRPFNTICMCPNCHALAKNGGCDLLSGIFEDAEKYDNNDLIPDEVPEFNGDYYLTEVEINGEKKTLKISPNHMREFAAFYCMERNNGTDDDKQNKSNSE